MHLTSRTQTSAVDPGQWGRGEPLWKLVPKRDAEGRAFTDFMMLAPALKRRSSEEITCVIRVIQGVLERFDDGVAFADFNMDLMLLWVSLVQRPRLMTQVVAALRLHVPELKLIAHQPPHGI
jgi:hypothetical protein